MSPGSGLGPEAHVQEVGPVWVLTGPSNHTVRVGRGTLHQRLALQGPGWEGRKHRPAVSLGWGLRQPLGGSLGAWGWAGASSPSSCSGGVPGQSGPGLGQPWGAGTLGAWAWGWAGHLLLLLLLWRHSCSPEMSRGLGLCFGTVVPHRPPANASLAAGVWVEMVGGVCRRPPGQK